MGKVKLTLSVEEDVVQKARALGLNLSKVCENALNDYIKRLEAPKYRYVAEDNASTKVIGSPEEIRTPVAGSKALEGDTYGFPFPNLFLY